MADDDFGSIDEPHAPEPLTADQQRIADTHALCGDCGGYGYLSTMDALGRETTEPCANPLHAAIVRWAKKAATQVKPRPAGEWTAMTCESTGLCFCGRWHGDPARWEPYEWDAWWKEFGGDRH